MAGMTADAVYVLLGNEIVLLTEKIEQMGGWEPLEHKGTVQTVEDLPTDAKKGWMYNIATDSIYGAAGMNVVMTSEGWDSMGPIINMALYLTKEEAGKSYQPKGNYLSGTDSTLTEPGKAADAKETGDKFSKTSADLEEKLDKNQGSENSGKIAGINESGDIVPMFPVGVEYNEETNCLEFGSDQGMKLNQGIGLDSTLTKTGFAADAGVTGKEINSLKEDLSTKITKFYASNQGETHLADSDNGKIMDMMLYGKSEQKQYTGKNLLNYDAWSQVNCTNGKAVYENNGVTITALTNDAFTNFEVSEFPTLAQIPVSEGETVILSWKSPDIDANVFIFPNGETKGMTHVNNRGTKSLTYTATSGVTFITFRFGVANAGDTISYKNIQIEKGSTATSYEPYTGGQPSPSPDYPQEIKSVVNPTVKVCGKNLLKATLRTTTTNGVTCTANGDGTYTLNGTASDDTRFIVGSPLMIQSRKYKVCGCPIGGSISNYYIAVAGDLPDYGKGNVGLWTSYTTTWEYRIYVKKGTVCNNLLFKPMLTTDLTATYDDFEPYHEQTVTLPYDLYGVKVPSGGNVTIDGQQYVSDYFDVERGKLVRMIDDVEAKNYTWDLYPNGNNMPRRFGMNDTIRFNMPADIRIMSSHFKQIASNTRTDLSAWFQTYYIAITDMNEKWKNSEALIQWFSENNVHFYLPLKTPEEIDLTPEEIAALKALSTYYPTTNISVNLEQLDGYTVFNYPISMKTGWNYVKQQIGDTRDYIYGMDARAQDTDLQAAEAYVNSEYAVALTELEV